MIPLSRLARTGEIAISLHKSVRAALAQVERERLPGLIVLEDESILGAVTNLDLALSHPNRLILDAPIRKVSPLLESMDTARALEIVRKEKVGVHPLVNEDARLMGLISLRDIAESIITQEKMAPESTSTAPGDQTILIVDDSPLVLKSLEKTLRKVGYKTDTASAGKEALEKLRENPPDLLILDVHMPRMSGYEVLRKMRDDPATINIPVIMLTAMSDIENRIEAFAGGADDYVLKPYNSTELLTRINNLLKMRALYGELKKTNKEKKKYIARLQELREFNENVIENMGSGLAVMDLDGAVLKINQAALKALRIRLEADVLGRPITDINPALEVFCQVDQTQQHREMEFPISENFSVPLGFSSSYLLGSDGEKQGVITIFRDLTDRKRAEEALRKRVRELNCLFAISNLVKKPDTSLEEILQGTVDIVPVGFQYPEITCARITLEDQTFKTVNFEESAWKLISDIIVDGDRVGAIEVFCLQEQPEIDEGPFLREERNLINAIAEQLGKTIKSRRADEMIKKAATEWRITFDTMPDLVMVLDRDHRIARVNRTMAKALELSFQEILGKKCFQCVHGSNAPHESCVYTQAMADGKEHTFEMYEPRLDGYFLVSITPILDDNGTPTGSVHIMHDITKRKQAEEERIRLAAAIEQAAEIVLITDAKGTIQYVNPAFEKVTGYSSEDVVGQNPRILKSGIHDEAFYKEMWNTLTRGETWTGLFTNKKKDGTFYQEETMISPVNDASGKIINYVAVKRDITKEIALQEQLFKSEKLAAIGQIAGGIAHEIKNPLFAISTGLQALERYMAFENESEDVDKKDFGLLFRVLYKETERINRLVESLGFYGREHGLVLSEFSPHEFIDFFLKVNSGLIASKALKVQKRIPKDIPVIEADRDKLLQVMENVVLNAIEFSPYGGMLFLSVNVSNQGDAISFEIGDEGPGIPEENLERIFDIFYSTRKGGTGFGLAISRKIVEMHEGTIHAKNREEGGALFTISLPLRIDMF